MDLEEQTLETSRHTQMIIDFICDTQYEDIPAEAIENAKARILDCIGVTIKGGEESVGTVIKEFAGLYGGKEQATIINAKMRSDVLTAVFANGTMSHAIDYDDHYVLSHPSIGPFAALLPVAELVNATGKEIVTAFAVGLEFSTKFQMACTIEPWYNGFHSTGLWNTMAACVTAGKLLKLSKEQMLMAFGTACSSFCGIKRNMGTMTKSYHNGRAGDGGVRAALLAKLGFTSHPDAFEGRFGFLHVFVKELEPRFQYIEELGKEWDLVNHPTLIKPHPSCGGTHAAMNGMLQLIREHDIYEQDVDHVDVGMNQGGVDSLYYPEPKNIYEAKFSMHFVIALLLHYRRWGVDLHTNEVVNSPEMRALYPKVNFFVDEELDREIPREMTDYHAIVTVYMKDGTVYRIHSNPPRLSWEQIKEKYDQTVVGVIDKERSEAIVDVVRSLEARSLSDLMPLLA